MPGWTVARLLSSIPTHRSRHRRRRLTPALAASAAGDVIDDGDAEMIDDNATYFSVPLDIKPPGWILTSVCYWHIMLLYITSCIANRAKL